MHVLIVEDDAKIAEFVARGFREAGFRTTRAADGEDGLLQAQHGPFDAAIVDIMLPKMDGLELIRRLRASGSKLPVVVLSARSSVDSRIAGLEAGGDDYVSKPFSIAEVIVRVQTVLRRASADPETVLRAGDLEMDLVTRSSSACGTAPSTRTRTSWRRACAVSATRSTRGTT